MRLRNLLILLWAINNGGLMRIFVLGGILGFLALAILMFLALIGGPGEMLRHMPRP
jgi:hypothetical protein